MGPAVADHHDMTQTPTTRRTKPFFETTLGGIVIALAIVDGILFAGYIWYVNSDDDFTDHHVIINGASQLVRDVFGDAGRHARTALGMAQLPLGSSVEVEMILRLKEA